MVVSNIDSWVWGTIFSMLYRGYAIMLLFHRNTTPSAGLSGKTAEWLELIRNYNETRSIKRYFAKINAGGLSYDSCPLLINQWCIDIDM